MDKSLNYSPIKVGHKSILFGHKETEPKIVAPKEPVVELSEQVDKPQQEPKSESEPTIEIIPDLPELDQELKDQGVEVVDHDTIFTANGKKIDLPISIDDVQKGFHKPFTSGWRWLSELTAYILAKLGIKIKKHGRKAKLVEQH